MISEGFFFFFFNNLLPIQYFFYNLLLEKLIVCLNYFFEKLSGPVAMINGLCGVKVLRGGILVILFDACVVEGKLITLSMHGLVKSSMHVSWLKIVPALIN